MTSKPTHLPQERCFPPGPFHANAAWTPLFPPASWLPRCSWLRLLLLVLDSEAHARVHVCVCMHACAHVCAYVCSHTAHTYSGEVQRGGRRLIILGSVAETAEMPPSSSLPAPVSAQALFSPLSSDSLDSLP